MKNLEKRKKYYKQFNDIINSILYINYNQKNIINLALSIFEMGRLLLINIVRLLIAINFVVGK
jgi:hypothetical protein